VIYAQSKSSDWLAWIISGHPTIHRKRLKIDAKKIDLALMDKDKYFLMTYDIERNLKVINYEENKQLIPD
jgi:hypothetical protein